VVVRQSVRRARRSRNTGPFPGRTALSHEPMESGPPADPTKRGDPDDAPCERVARPTDGFAGTVAPSIGCRAGGWLPSGSVGNLASTFRFANGSTCISVTEASDAAPQRNVSRCARSRFHGDSIGFSRANRKMYGDVVSIAIVVRATVRQTQRKQNSCAHPASTVEADGNSWAVRRSSRRAATRAIRGPCARGTESIREVARNDHSLVATTDGGEQLHTVQLESIARRNGSCVRIHDSARADVARNSRRDPFDARGLVRAICGFECEPRETRIAAQPPITARALPIDTRCAILRRSHRRKRPWRSSATPLASRPATSRPSSVSIAGASRPIASPPRNSLVTSSTHRTRRRAKWACS
jgi:hypothetical protein